MAYNNRGGLPPFDRAPGGASNRFLASPAFPPGFDAPIRPSSSASNRSQSSFLSQIPLPDDFFEDEYDAPPARSHGVAPAQGQHQLQHNTIHMNAPSAPGRVGAFNSAGEIQPMVWSGVRARPLNQAPSQQAFSGPYNMAAPHLPHNQVVVYSDREQSNVSRNSASMIRSGAFDDVAEAEAAFGEMAPFGDQRARRGGTHGGRGGRSSGRGGFSGSHGGRPRDHSFGGQAALLIEPARAQDVPAPASNVASPPAWFEQVAHGKSPNLDQAFTDMPLCEAWLHQSGPSSAGVLRMTNIPFTAARTEIVAVLGRFAQILQQPADSPYHAIHIVMDRMSGKSQDCFIEVTSPAEATRMLSQFNRRILENRHPKLGDRSVNLKMSTQQELMAALYPRAKCVKWDINGVPEILETDEEYAPGVPSKGFQGFMVPEELNILIKLAEDLQRSPFVQRVPSRPYECLISTLNKYPWYDAKHVFLSERKLLFDVTNAHLKCLGSALHNIDRPKEFTLLLLEELVVAAMGCPGFGEKQKASFASTLHALGFSKIASGANVHVPFGGLHPYAGVWPFLALTKTHTAREDFFEYYMGLFRAAAEGKKVPSLSEILSARQGVAATDTLTKIHIEYKTEDFGTLTLEKAAKKELKAISNILCAALPHKAVFG